MSLDLLVLGSFLLIGVGTGFMSGLFGVGGGFVLVPMLVAADTPIHIAVGTSLGYIAVTSLYGSYKHFKSGNIYLEKTTYVIIISSIALVGVGSRLGDTLDEDQLTRIFGLLLAFTAGYFLFKRKWFDRRLRQKEPTQKEKKDINTSLVANGFLGVIVGLLSGIFGVGGGFLLVPALVLFIRMPIKLAVGTSLFVVIFSSFAGAAVHGLRGNIDLSIVPLLVAGGLVGVKAGVIKSNSISAEVLEGLYIGVMCLAAIFMVLK